MTCWMLWTMQLPYKIKFNVHNSFQIQRVGATTRSNVWVGRRRSDGDGEVVLKYIEADPVRKATICIDIGNYILFI